MSRDDFTLATKRTLLTRVAGFCSRPECRKMTVIPYEENPSAYHVVGRAAHIAAASLGGPRYDHNMSPTERKSAENGIWLCAHCADLVDKKGGENYSIELLRGWKKKAEKEIENAALLSAVSQKPKWLDSIRTPHFINVPRLLSFDCSLRLSSNTTKAIEYGFPKEGYILPELVEITQNLRNLSIKAVDVEQLLRPDEQIKEGLIISFYQRCRTKNGARTELDAIRNYSFNNSPLIYFNRAGYRFVCPYDPCWLTTNTAHSDMRSGSVTIAGIAIVKRIDHNIKDIICSPLTFGVPDIFGFYN